MKKLLVIVSTLFFAVGLSACNTVKGFGKDVERGGEAVQNTAEDVRK